MSAMTGWQRIRPGVLGLSAGMVVAALALAHVEPGGLAERGRTLYAQHCASCHGVEGQGRAWGNATALNNPDFLAAADDAFQWATIAYGRRETPMFPSLRRLGGVRQFTEAEIDDLVAYLQGWQRPR